MTKEHRDYELCKEFWRSYNDLENTPERTLILYYEFIQEERRKQKRDLSQK